MTAQIALWCSRCGDPRTHARGMCLPCYDRWRLSQNRFEGQREDALARDAQRCRVCGSDEKIIVHHRKRKGGVRVFVTGCAACHARIHRSRRPRWHWSPLLRTLWREQHPHEKEQLSLLVPDDAPDLPEQLTLAAKA